MRIYYSLFLSLFFLYSRGLFELWFSKKNSYLIEGILSIVFLFIFLWNKIEIIKVKFSSICIVCLLLSLVCISTLSTDIGAYNVYCDLYILYFIVISVMYLFFTSVQYRNLNYSKIINSLSYNIYILVFIAILEQLKVLHLPGESKLYYLIRPASLTGSYLHYPLILATLGITVHSLEKKIKFTSLLSYICVFISLSRSGMLILFIVFISYLTSKLLKAKHIFINQKRILTFTTAVFLINSLIFYLKNLITKVVERFFSMFSLNSPGNPGRIHAWIWGIKKINYINIFAGNNFGEITNFSKNIEHIHSKVVESSFLQLILNIGLIGTCLFYMIFIHLLISTKSKLFKLFLIAFLIESLFYQSIEVMPFIFSIFIFFSIIKTTNKEMLCT